MFDVKKLRAKRDEKRKLSPRQPQKRQAGRVGLKEFPKRAPPPIDVLSDEEFIEHVIEKVRIISDKLGFIFEVLIGQFVLDQ